MCPLVALLDTELKEQWAISRSFSDRLFVNKYIDRLSGFSTYAKLRLTSLLEYTVKVL